MKNCLNCNNNTSIVYNFVECCVVCNDEYDGWQPIETSHNDCMICNQDKDEMKQYKCDLKRFPSCGVPCHDFDEDTGDCNHTEPIKQCFKCRWYEFHSHQCIHICKGKCDKNVYFEPKEVKNEVICYDKKLKYCEREEIEQYLMNKFSIPVKEVKSNRSAKEYLEQNSIWAKVDDLNLTKRVMIEFAETYHNQFTQEATIPPNFWQRLEMFVKDITVNDMASDEEKQMILLICKEQQL